MSAFESVSKVVKEWQPGPQPSELKYRDSLTALLREKMKGSRIETEYRHSGTTIDIYVKEPGFFGPSEVYVELKRNLTQKTQLDRLVGQVESLEPEKNYVLVVLCGETSPALLTRFKEKYGLGNFSWGKMEVVVKKDVVNVTTAR